MKKYLNWFSFEKWSHEKIHVLDCTIDTFLSQRQFRLFLLVRMRKVREAKFWKSKKKAKGETWTTRQKEHAKSPWRFSHNNLWLWHWIHYRKNIVLQIDKSQHSARDENSLVSSHYFNLTFTFKKIIVLGCPTLVPGLNEYIEYYGKVTR